MADLGFFVNCLNTVVDWCLSVANGQTLR